MPETIESTWNIPLIGTKPDKRGGRTLTEKGWASEIIGIDPSEEGAVRPFPGFFKVHELGPSGGMASLEGGNHTATGSKLVDCYPFYCRVGTSSYAYGFVYRIQRPSSALADVFVDWWSPLSSGCTSTAWPDSCRGKLIAAGVTTSTLMNHSYWPWRPNANPVKSLSVTVWGQFVYVHVQGAAPRRFYVNSSGSLVTIGASGSPFPGPGKQPRLVSYELSGLVGSIQSLTTGGVTYPGRGQIKLLSILPSLLGVYPCTGSGTTGTSTLPTTGTATFSCCGGADVPPQPDSSARLYAAGGYTFAYQLYDSRTGLRSALSEVAQVVADDFKLGGSTSASRYIAIEIAWDNTKYDTAYIYKSVRTQDTVGVYGGTVLHLEKIITLDAYKTCQSPYSTTIGQAVFYYGLDDKVLAFQAPYQDSLPMDEEMPSSGSTFLYENTMFMGKITRGVSGMIDASTSLEFRDGDSYRTTAEIRFSSLTTPPPENVPPSHRYSMPVPGNEIEVFKEAAGSLIGFSSDRQYFIRKDSNSVRVEPLHEGNGVVGPRAADTVGSTIYFLNNKGLRSVDSQGKLDELLHLNYLFKKQWLPAELPHVSMAYDPRLAALFILNPCRHHMAGIYFSTSRSTELVDTGFSQVVRGFFPVEGTDPTYMALLLDYSAKPEERCLFISDTPYEGDPGTTNTNTDSDLSSWRPRIYVVNDRRLLTKKFFANNSDTAHRRISGTMMPVSQSGIPTTVGATIQGQGACYWSMASAMAGSQSVTVSTDASNITAADALPAELENSWVYIFSADPTHSYMIGTKALIKKKTGASTFKLMKNATLRDPLAEYPMSYFQGQNGFAATMDQGSLQMPTDGTVSAPTGSSAYTPAGTRIIISPIYMRWVGAPLEAKSELGVQFESTDNYSRLRHVNSVSLTLTGISGPSLAEPAGNTDQRFRALLYRGEERDPLAFAHSRNRLGAAGVNMNEGVSTLSASFGNRRWPPTTAEDSVSRPGYSHNVLTPGFEIISADLDFQVLSMVVTGTTEAQSRPNRNT